MKHCPQCNYYFADNTQFCSQCGSILESTGQTPPPYQQNPGNYDPNNAFDASGPEGKSRGIAALLAIFLGGLGIHYFYLNKVSAGFLSILLSVVTCGIWEVIMVIQGILMFFMTNAEFQRKYVETQSQFPVF